MIDKDRFLTRRDASGFRVSLETQPFLSSEMDHVESNPVILNSSDFCQADMDTGILIIQPETNFHKITRSQEIWRADLGRGCSELHHTSISLEGRVHSGQHAVNRHIGNRPAGLLLS